jgi:hypothetical protein
VRNAYKILAGKLKGKRLIGIPRFTWGYIKMDLKERGWNVWIEFIGLTTRARGGLLRSRL